MAKSERRGKIIFSAWCPPPKKDGEGVANFGVMGGPVKLAFQCEAIPYGGSYIKSVKWQGIPCLSLKKWETMSKM